PLHQSTLLPYTTLFRSQELERLRRGSSLDGLRRLYTDRGRAVCFSALPAHLFHGRARQSGASAEPGAVHAVRDGLGERHAVELRSEEHTSELHSRVDLV